MTKVVIGVPNKGNIFDPKAYDNHLEFMFKLGKYSEKTGIEFFLTTIPRVFPALARERIAEHAVESVGADYIFMWDDDMVFPMDLFERLLAHNVDIIAPLAFTRLGPYRPVIYNLTDGYDPVDKKSYYINKIVHNYPKNKLVECDAVGFGSVLIKTSVLKAMPKPWFMTTSGAGEDIHFCHQARKKGFRVFVDTSVKIGHIGDSIVVDEDAYEAQEEVKNIREVHGEAVKYGN